MKKAGLLLILALLALPLFGAETKMEVRIFYQNPDLMVKTMGDLFGELDICTVRQASPGNYYLVINTDQTQLKEIQALGFRTEITYADIRDKIAMYFGGRDPELYRNFGFFFTYWETRDSLTAWAARYPTICKLDSAGRSYQGLALLTLKVSDNPAVDEGEPAALFNGATHAREPMGNYMCLDYIQYLLYNYNTDSLVHWFVNNRQIYFIPVMNPDGYRYNSDSGGATSNIRKNRHFYTGQSTATAGVDLNRNYGYKWGWDDIGSSPNVTQETFRGSGRFSELETQAARDYYLPKKIRTQMDYHSYGPYNLCVWGYSTNHEPIPDSATIWEMLDSMRAKDGFPAASTGPCSRVLYLANGGSFEWETKDTLWNGVQKFMTYAMSIETDQTDFWDGATNMATITNCINECRPVNIYYTKIAGVFFDNLVMTVADTALGNHNGQLDPNETSHIWFALRNRAIHPLDSAYSVTGNLVSLDTQVTVQTANANFPKIYRKATGNNSLSRFQVHCSPNAVPGTYKKFRLIMTFKDDTCTITQALRCSLVVGNNPVAVAEPKPPLAGYPRLTITKNPSRGNVRFQASGLIPGEYKLEIFNAAGQLVDRQVFPAGAGKRDFTWNERATPGVYFYRFLSAGYEQNGKFVLIE
jgi:hypothetical protein